MSLREEFMRKRYALMKACSILPLAIKRNSIPTFPNMEIFFIVFPILFFYTEDNLELCNCTLYVES